MKIAVRRLIDVATAALVIGIAAPSAIAAADDAAAPDDGTMVSAIVVAGVQATPVDRSPLPAPASAPLPAPAPVTQSPLVEPGPAATPPVGLNTKAHARTHAGAAQSPIQACAFFGIPC